MPMDTIFLWLPPLQSICSTVLTSPTHFKLTAQKNEGNPYNMYTSYVPYVHCMYCPISRYLFSRGHTSDTRYRPSMGNFIYFEKYKLKSRTPYICILYIYCLLRYCDMWYSKRHAEQSNCSPLNSKSKDIFIFLQIYFCEKFVQKQIISLI